MAASWVRRALGDFHLAVPRLGPTFLAGPSRSQEIDMEPELWGRQKCNLMSNAGYCFDTPLFSRILC